MATPLRLLLIEDSEDDAMLLLMELQNGRYAPQFTRVETAEELRVALKKGPWDAVFADYSLPGFTGLDALRIMQEMGIDLPFIIVSGVIGEEQAVEALKAGAHDFILKGQYARLVPALKRALNDAVLRHERRQTAEELSRHREHLEDLVQLRTEELEAANEELQVQTEELQEQSEWLQAQGEALERLNTDLAAHASELEAANLELEAFNHTVSHDLRGPLTVIGGYSSVLKEMCSDRLDEECTGYLDEIDNGIQKMSSLIETLLRFSRLAHTEVRQDAVDLGEMAEGIIGGLRMTEPERAVRVTIAPGLRVVGDRELLQLALENLLGNAWKYTGKREEVVIEFGAEEIDGKPVYFVRDNGSGFENADADKIFVPFQRLPGAEEFKGFGIGLATVARIIQCHKGRVWAEGKPGEGATFYFTLPSAVSG